MKINKIVAWSLVLVFAFGVNIALAKNQPNGTPFAALWNDITGLQDQIDELEERIEVLEGSGCVSEPEVCDNLDNDCDGDIDEDNVCDPCSQNPEICDGQDNDCDGFIDEDFSYSGSGIGQACGIGECTGGTVVCLSEIEATCDTADQATTEICDSADNDCDGAVDEDNVCHPDGTPCDDGNLCTVGDTYLSGVCVGGALMVCNDNNECTSDSCSPGGGCVFDVNTSQGCDDGNSCTEQDICDGAGSCVGGAAMVCDDDNECTTDSCNPGSGCTFIPNTAQSCDDGLECTVQDMCDSQGSCVGTSTPSCS